jgi:hypothetical protein
MINIQSSKFHEVKAFELFTKPNEVLTDILKREVNIFKESDLLYTFTTSGLPGITSEERIRQILEYGTPRYYCEAYPEGDKSYTENYPVGAFFATKNHISLDLFFSYSSRYGELLLVYEKQQLQTTGHGAIYKIKEGHTYPEALQAMIYPSFEAANARDYSQTYRKILDVIHTQKNF